MGIYLHDVPLPEAKARFATALKAAGLWGLLGGEEIPLDEKALGRILAKPVWAKISSPHYHASAMDGFAVRSADTTGAMPNQPVKLFCIPLAEESRCAYLDTGDPLPAWADAVIPIENVESYTEDGQIAKDPHNPYLIKLRSAVTPWSHVRPMGEDIVATQLVLPAGHILRPVDLGAIAACGHDRVRVARKPRVAILPTGTELVPVGQPVRAGDIIEYNSLVLAAQVNTWGGEAHRFPITPDRFEEIQKQVIEAAQDHDLILLNAGSSAGSEDYSARVVESLGELLVHGVAIRPGHPVIIGMIHAASEPLHVSIPVIGVPGYPVSAALTAEIFIEPLLACWLGRRASEPEILTATLTRKVTSPAGDDDYLRVAVGKVGEKMLAAPLSRGSGVITSLVRADGIAILPRGSQGLPEGAEIKVHLYRPISELVKTILAIGSHDVTLDIMAQFLATQDRRLSSANVGSLGGLIALRRGEAHLAGSHLLDAETGEYNLSYIHKYLSGVPVKVLAFVGRQQGLLVQKGNPKSIQGLEDLARADITFVNRQRGAGTRVLLDYHLKKLRIVPEHIRGYSQEEYTHLAVAAAIASGRADCGLGIAAAARALDLDFISLFQERYDLVILDKYYNSELLAPFIAMLKDGAFQTEVSSLPGYDIARMGDLISEIR